MNHARALAASPRIDFSAICDLDAARAQKAAEKHDVDAYTSTEEMLEQDIESVVIVTQARNHAKLSIQALEAGKNVLCEKPIADSIENGYKMVKAARSSGLKAAIGYQRRFDPMFWTMKKVSRDLDPLQITLTGQRGIFLEKYLRPGSAYGIMDAACHQIDLVNWLIGRSPTAVSGSIRSGIFTPTDAIDTASVQIEYGPENDERTGNVIVSMGGPGLTNFCHLVGKNGNAEGDGDKNIKITSVTFDENAGREKERQVTEGRLVEHDVLSDGNSTMALEEAFTDCVQGEASEIATFQDGLDALLVLEATSISSKRGDKVDLQDMLPD